LARHPEKRLVIPKSGSSSRKAARHPEKRLVIPKSASSSRKAARHPEKRLVITKSAPASRSAATAEIAGQARTYFVLAQGAESVNVR
jgi:hypothetical protein